MRSLLVAIAFSAACLTGVPAAAQSNDAVISMLEPYFRIQTALTEDRIDGVKADAQLVAKQAKGLGEPAAPIVKAAGELAAAGEIAAARDAFGRLSDAVIAYSERVPTADGVHTMYCPMNQKSWLQKGDQVRNPYYGKAMLSCGEKKKKST